MGDSLDAAYTKAISLGSCLGDCIMCAIYMLVSAKKQMHSTRTPWREGAEPTRVSAEAGAQNMGILSFTMLPMLKVG